MIGNEDNRTCVLAWIGEQPVRYVTSTSDLERLMEEEVGSYDGIFVFAELKWGNHPLSSFFGIDVAVDLRLRLKMLAPMCIISFMPKSYFNGLEDVKYNIHPHGE